MTAFKGVALPLNKDLQKEFIESEAQGIPTVKLTSYVLRIARNEFQTKWRKNHDYFEMEEVGEKMIQDACLKCLNRVGWGSELHSDSYAFIKMAITQAFDSYNR